MKKYKLSTDKKSGDYNPFYDGVWNNVFPEQLTDEEMREMGFTSGEYKEDDNGYYAWVYSREIPQCCKSGCTSTKKNN